MPLTEPTYNRARFTRRLAGEDSEPEGTTERITLLARSSAHKVLALQVELCLPRLVASCAEPRWRFWAFDRGSGRRASPDSLLLGAVSRAFRP